MKSKLLICIAVFLFLVPITASNYQLTAGSTSTVLPPIETTQGEITPEATSTIAVSTIAKSTNVYSTSSLKQLILDTFPDAPIMVSIASCESRLRQFNSDGTVRRGVANNHDIGLFQINSDYHEEAAKKLGMDIYSLEGNVAYAKVLYERNGTRDWNWSKGMWSEGECKS